MSLIVGRLSRHFRKRRTTTSLVSTALWLAVTIPLVSAAAEEPAASVAAAQTETLVVRVNLNTENKGDLFVQRSPDLDFFLKVEDLKAIGFKDPKGTVQVIEGEPHLSLRSIRGVGYTFDTKSLALNITAEPHMLPALSIGLAPGRRRAPSIGSTDSAFLNYAISGTTGTGSSSGLSFAGEAGMRWGEFLFMSDGSSVDTPSGKRFVRLVSSVTRDDPQNLRRVMLGDFLTQSRDFSSSVNLGGISVTKVYGLDPTFVRFPTQSLSGSVALPSDMEVYLDGQRIRTERLRPGEFELRDILAYGGAQDVQVILKDSFGRVQQLSYSLYFSDQPLQAGLHEYSYNFGAIRRDFGIESNRYGPAALTMFHRYGVSNGMTLGWRAEGTRHFLNTGPTATVVLGALGVVNLGAAASTIAGRQGVAGLASYSYQSKNWNFGLFLRRDSSGYTSLGDPPLATNRKLEGSASASFRLPANGYLSLSHSWLTTRDAISPSVATPAQPFDITVLDNRRSTTLAYSTPLGSSRGQFSAGVSHIKDRLGGSRNEAFVGLSYPLGADYIAAANYRGDRLAHSESLRFTKNQPTGEGLGYTVSMDRFSATTQSTRFTSDLQYNAPAAVVRADYSHNRTQGQVFEDQRVSVAGAVLAVGNQVAFSRPLTESYAIVKVGELSGVDILVNNQAVAKTSSNGIAVLPRLSAYMENAVSLLPGAVPMEYALPARTKRVSPSPRSGSFIDFGVKRTQAFSGKLVSRVGGVTKPVALQEIDVSIEQKPQRLATGRAGEFYVENLKPGSYAASVSLDTGRCVFTLVIPESNEMFVDLGEVSCLPGQ